MVVIKAGSIPRGSAQRFWRSTLQDWLRDTSWGAQPLRVPKGDSDGQRASRQQTVAQLPAQTAKVPAWGRTSPAL